MLGVVPHQLRGFLGQFRTMPLVGAAYDRCTGCSETVRSSSFIFPRVSDGFSKVLKAYETRGFSMLLEAFNDAKYLETLTGLDKLYNEGDELLESVDWHGDEDEEDDF